MKCRKSVKDLNAAEKAAFRDALLALKTAPSLIPGAQTAVTNGGGTPNRYDDYVWIHNMIGGGAHRGPAFGPWHRELLRQFELDLRQVSGNPDITIPYWDWTTARTPADPGWPFTNDFLGGIGDAATGQISTSPFADPSQWRINIRRAGDSTLVLKRCRSTWGLVEAPPPNGPVTLSLPTRDTALGSFGIGTYDVAPFHSNPSDLSQAERTAQANVAFRKYLEWLLHDLIHVWVGGLWNFTAGGPQNGGHISFPPVAINDPAFWLHHSTVDRLWTIWQQRNPALPYEPASGANLGHNLDDTMERFGNPVHFNFPLQPRPADVVDYHGDDAWYASDLPTITPVSGSVSFGEVPEALTTHRPAQFTVRTCQPVRFRVTAVSAGNFSDPLGPAGVTVVNPSAGADTVTADVYLQFHAVGPVGTVQPASATIEAFVVDADGYFAPTVGGQHVVGSWTVTLSATPVPRPRTAVALVLDRSGSMSETAGALGTKYDLLKSSLQVVADIMRPDDAVGLVSYDHVVTMIAPITQMGALAPPGPGRQAVTNAINGPDLVPRGATAIGQGMIHGAAALDAERTAAGSPYSHLAMVVLTDGNENVSPNVTSGAVTTAIAPYSSNVYAIGLGREDNVSAATLGAIAKYMLITGDITTDEQRFRLTKYFVQILAGLTRTEIVVDPEGELFAGVEHRIPFTVTASDVGVDVIALCPLAFLLDMTLEAPDGTRIDPSTTSPNVRHFVGGEDAFYRMLLPALPAQGAGTHAGQWHAVLSVSDKGLRELLGSVEIRSSTFTENIADVQTLRSLPYSLIVQAESNLRFDVEVIPHLSRPGEVLQLFARLTEYSVPVAGTAAVAVEVTSPHGDTTSVVLTEVRPGAFVGTFPTSARGIYRCHFRAGGHTQRGRSVQREEARTAVVSRPGPPPGLDGRDLKGILHEGCEDLCQLLSCVVQEGRPGEVLAKLGIDCKRLVRGLSRFWR